MRNMRNLENMSNLGNISNLRNISNLGVDLAKNVFQLCGGDRRGKIILEERLNRKSFEEKLVGMKRCVVGMEASGGAHYWGRLLKKMGHEVKLMSPQYVKPYVKTNKNDRNDAEGIFDAMSRENMRFVPVKTVSQQDLQNLHNIYQRLLKNRTGLTNQMRGMLCEFGIVVAEGRAELKKQLPRILEDADNELSGMGRKMLLEVMEELRELEKKIALYDKRIHEYADQDERCRRLQTIPGVGPMTATALVSAIGSGYDFKRGRDLGAFLGLVPRQHSSGNSQRLGGISKRGNSYLRMLLVHGGRSVVNSCKKKNTKYARWVNGLVSRCGWNKATVAVANKNARIAWAILKSDGVYDPNKSITRH